MKQKRMMVGALLVAAGIVCIAVSRFGIFRYVQGTRPLAQGGQLADYQGEYVAYTVKYPLEVYAQEGVMGTDGELQKVRRVSYLTWDSQLGDYVCVNLSGDKSDAMESLLEQAWSYLTDESADDVSSSIKVSGEVQRMDEQELSLYKETLDVMFGEGYSSAVTQAYYIDDGRLGKMQTGQILFLTVAAVLLLLGGIGVLVIKREKSA